MNPATRGGRLPSTDSQPVLHTVQSASKRDIRENMNAIVRAISSALIPKGLVGIGEAGSRVSIDDSPQALTTVITGWRRGASPHFPPQALSAAIGVKRYRRIEIDPCEPLPRGMDELGLHGDDDLAAQLGVSYGEPVTGFDGGIEPEEWRFPRLAIPTSQGHLASGGHDSCWTVEVTAEVRIQCRTVSLLLRKAALNAGGELQDR